MNSAVSESATTKAPLRRDHHRCHAEYVDECRRQAVVLTKHSHPRAALVPLDDENDLERFLLARNPKFQDLLARSAKSGRTPLADAEAQLVTKPRESDASQAKSIQVAQGGQETPLRVELPQPRGGWDALQAVHSPRNRGQST